jgi:CHAD domain-containing protein
LKILRSQVEELANELGRLREWDVFVLETLPSICVRIPHQYGLDILIKECNAKRDYHHDAVKRKLVSPDFQRLLLRFGAWMCGTYWQQASNPEESLCDFVRNDLNQRSERVIKLSERIDNADAIQLHKFRIACKKLRYCTEMFGEVLGEYRSYLASLSDLQQISGNLNDISVAFVLLNELETPEWHEVITLMRVCMEHDYAELFKKLLKAKQSFSAQPSFW